MKPVLLLTALAILSSGGTKAQIPVVSNVLPKIIFGVKIGANFQELNGAPLFKSEYNAGYMGGAFVAFTKRKIGIQVEGLVSSAKIDYVPLFTVGPPPPTYAKLLYLSVPVLFEYKLIPRLWIQAGPQINDLISAKSNQGADEKWFKSNDFGGALGLQGMLPLHLTVSARYILGLTNVNNTSSLGTWHNNSIQLSAGFRFL